jgi:hypothetical protein
MTTTTILYLLFGAVSGFLFVQGTRRDHERLVACSAQHAYFPSLLIRCCMVFFVAGCAHLLTGQPLSYDFAGAFAAAHVATTLLVARRML